MKGATVIKNPLTVIAIFATITETVCGIVMPLIRNDNNQLVFLSFVILFPTILVIAFFITLYRKHRVLYAPIDYAESTESVINLFQEVPENSILNIPEINQTEQTIPLIGQQELTLEFIDKQKDPDAKDCYKFAFYFKSGVKNGLNGFDLDQINFHSINKTVHVLEVRVNTKKDDKAVIQRHVFVVFVHGEFNFETNETEVTGVLAGSGKNTINNPNDLANYTVEVIKKQHSRLKRAS